uniref:Uncharacterized protein n=2 Tax=Auxenochlorella protothecoides TaxID=3075 RepID=A0A1D1ZSR7_AUXPR
MLARLKPVDGGVGPCLRPHSAEPARAWRRRGLALGKRLRPTTVAYFTSAALLVSYIAWASLGAAFTLVPRHGPGGDHIQQPPHKVALLFLSRGSLPMEPVWKEFFEHAALLRQPPGSSPGRKTWEDGGGQRHARGKDSAASSIDRIPRASPHPGGRSAGQRTAREAALPQDLRALLDESTGLLRLPDTQAMLSSDKAAEAHDTHNELASGSLEAPFSALSLLDPQGPVARQDLFSVHTHTRAAFAFPPDSVFAGTQIDRRVFVRWGQYSAAEAMRRLIIAALRDPRNQRFAFLSESCAPLFPPAVVHAQLLADRLSRVSLCPQHGKAAERWGPYLHREGLLTKVHWRKSSQWLSLTKSHAEVVRRDDSLWRLFEQECYSYEPGGGLPLPPYMRAVGRSASARRSCVSDEHYFPTLLAVAGLQNETSCEGSLTFTHWAGGGWSPKVYRARDVGPELLRVMRRGVWETRECPVAAALASAAAQHRARGSWAGLGLPRELHHSDGDPSPPGYQPMPDRCMLFARKFAPDALPALLRLGGVCDQEGTAIHPSCLSQDMGVPEVRAAVY